MTANPWINRAAALALLLVVYAAGRVDGRDQTVTAMANHPACHQELKP